MTASYYLPRGSAAAGGFDLEVTPASAGWTYSSLRVLTLPAGGDAAVGGADEEIVVLPLNGGCTVEAAGERLELTGRPDVFAGPSDFAYLPTGMEATVASAGGGRFALCGAWTETQRPVRYGTANSVAVEQRGAGQCGRQVRNFGTPDALDAGALIACEVITPGGHWSSYPAHKHDQAGPHESELEEIYYFQIAAGPHGEPGIGFFRTSASPAGEIDVCVEVHDGDTVLVPYGWHGPASAAPGQDMYYLNVMAGPVRSWQITDHPDQAWIRDTWKDA